MTTVDPWVDQLISLFESLQNSTEIQQREILTRINFGRTTSIASNLRNQTSAQREVLLGSVKEWSDSGLQDAYSRGALTVTSEQMKMTQQQASELRALQERTRYDLQNAVTYQKRDYDRFVKNARGQQGKVSGRWMAKNSIRGAKYSDGRKVTTDAYARMQIQTATSTARNMGILHAASLKGVQFLEVQDGPECGWDGHDDTEKANGLIIPNDHDVILLSHPYCVRTFIPRPDLNKNKAQKAAAKITATSKQAAKTYAEAKALPALGKLLFTVSEDVVNEQQANEIFGGSLFEGALNRAYEFLNDKFRKGGQVIPFHYPPPIEPEPFDFPQAVGFGDQFLTPSQGEALSTLKASASGSPVDSVEGWKDDVMKWGDALLDHKVSFDVVPDWLKDSIEATNVVKNDYTDKTVTELIQELTARGLDNTLADRATLMKRLQLGDNSAFMQKMINFSEKVEKARTAKFASTGDKALRFVLKKKDWNQFNIYQGANKWASDVKGTWTKYGPRITTDFTDFLRGRFTFTKDGIRRTIAFDPAGALRTNLGITQDGTLIGHLALVPNRIFSAVAEINDFGNLESELRFNPFVGGRMRILFEAPRPKNWWLDEGLSPGEDFVDFRADARSVAGRSRPWTQDLTTLSHDELNNKWHGDKSFQRFKFMVEHLQDPEWNSRFKEEVSAAVEDGFTDNKDVQLWLSVIKDLPDDATPRLYRGLAWDPSFDDEGTFPKGMTNKEITAFLQRKYAKGSRIDEFYASWSSDRGEAWEYAFNQTGMVRKSGDPSMPIIWRLKEGARGIQEQKLIDDPEWVFYDSPWSAGGSYVVNGSKYDSKLKAFVVDLEYLGTQTDEALAGRRFGVEDFTFRELLGEFKKMRPKDVIFDVPIVNKGIAQLSSEFRLPIDEVRTFVTDQFQKGLLKLTGKGKYSGTVSFNPAADLLKLISDSAGRQSINGTLSFAEYLPNWASFLDPDITANWNRTLVDLAGKDAYHMQQLIGNLRLSGIAMFDSAPKMELARLLDIPQNMMENFSKAVDEVDARIRLFLIKNQRSELQVFGKTVIPKGKLFPAPILNPRDIAPLIEKRLAPLLEREDIRSEKQVFQTVVDAIRGVSQTTVARTEVDEETGALVVRQVVHHTPNRPISTKFLKQLADIKSTDSKAVIENKLHDIVFFLRASTLDNPELNEVLNGIDNLDLSLAATELENPRIGLATQLHPDQVIGDVESFIAPAKQSIIGETVSGYTDASISGDVGDSLREDIETVAGALQHEFPALPWKDLYFSVEDLSAKGVLAEYRPGNDVIVFDRFFMQGMGEAQRQQMMAEMYGAGNVDRKHILAHEIAHWMWNKIPDEIYDFTFQQMYESTLDIFGTDLGSQGALGPEEFIAEGIANYAYGLTKFGDIPKGVFQYFTDAYDEMVGSAPLEIDGKPNWEQLGKTGLLNNFWHGKVSQEADSVIAKLLFKEPAGVSSEEWKKMKAVVLNSSGRSLQEISDAIGVDEGKLFLWFADDADLESVAAKYGTSIDEMRAHFWKIYEDLDRVPPAYTGLQMNHFVEGFSSMARKLPATEASVVESYIHTSAALNTYISENTVSNIGRFDIFKDEPFYDELFNRVKERVLEEVMSGSEPGDDIEEIVSRKITAILDGRRSYKLGDFFNSEEMAKIDSGFEAERENMSRALKILGLEQRGNVPSMFMRGIRDPKFAEEVAATTPGDEVVLKGFHSTSLDYTTAAAFAEHDVVLMIEPKLGSNVLIGPYELEYVLDGGHFEVIQNREKLIWLRGRNPATDQFELHWKLLRLVTIRET